MKKFVLVLALFVGIVGVSFAQSDLTESTSSGELTLTGTISKQASVAITTLAAATFDLDQAGLGPTQVGTALFKSNFNKWIVTVYSTNGSKLVREGDTHDAASAVGLAAEANPVTAEVTKSIPYTFDFVQDAGVHTWEGTYIPLKAAVAPTAEEDGYYEMIKKTVVAGESVKMFIDITEKDSETNYWDAGVYTDTIKVSILAP